ncbi:MAG: IgGFc-binding protein [Deltaproteobacteria bacterium]|nr:IgGFc-binding protein [Deltaproteobacteria bacterium]
MRSRTLIFLLLLAFTLSTACTTGGRGRGGSGGSDDDDSANGDDDDVSNDDDDGDDDDSTAGPCSPEGATACNGIEFMECVDGTWNLADECLPPEPICHSDLGCLECNPGQLSCDGNDIVECNPTGFGTAYVDTCPDESPCIAGVCQDPCTLAATQFSYLGCDFLAVSSTNIVESVFDNNFAVIVGNPESSTGTAEVTVERNGSIITSQSVGVGQTAAITLPMVQGLKSATGSVIEPGGAYEIRSSVPVAAYQYNPLDFVILGTNSFSNDASLLLPEHTLTGQYMISQWPTFGVGQGSGSSVSWIAFQPGFFSVAATADNTSVTMDFTGRTAPGNPGQFSAGQSTTVNLDRGDVVQVMSYYEGNPSSSTYCGSQGWLQTTGLNNGTTYTYCIGDDTDLTGTVVTATQAVAVFAGHQCSFVPYDAWACDHLEEMMFPTATWGTTSVMTAPRLPQNSSAVARTKYRVVALNGAEVSFDPAVTGAQTLSAGQVMEFETDQDFVVTGTGPIYVTQTMLGQDELGTAIGDPAMGSGIPWVQVRNEYDFLTPSTFTENWVNVVATSGTTVLLDGAQIGGWETIGSTGYSVARVSLNAGSHHIESQDLSGFGITTYGYASYTSYLYPGGLNFLR